MMETHLPNAKINYGQCSKIALKELASAVILQHMVQHKPRQEALLQMKAHINITPRAATLTMGRNAGTEQNNSVSITVFFGSKFPLSPISSLQKKQ